MVGMVASVGEAVGGAVEAADVRSIVVALVVEGVAVVAGARAVLVGGAEDAGAPKSQPQAVAVPRQTQFPGTQLLEDPPTDRHRLSPFGPGH